MMLNLATQVAELRNVAQFIADSLSSMIYEGRLLPGDRLIQTDIAGKFGVSRLPVRDALKILESRELAVTLPRKGVVVRPISVKEIEDLYEMRIILEIYAFDRALVRMTQEDIAEVEAIILEQEQADVNTEFLRLMEIDERFHEKIWSKCENEEIRRTLSTVWRKVKMARAFAREVPEWNIKSAQGHRRIIDSIRKGDHAAARQFLTEGMLRSRSETIEQLQLRTEG